MNTVNCAVVFVAMLTALLCIQIAAQNTNRDFNNKATDQPGSAVVLPELYPITEGVQYLLSKQVAHELSASIEYLAMASYFGQDNVSLMGFKKFFMDNSDEEKEHAKKLVDYLNERNGKLGEINIQFRIGYSEKTGLEALKDALKMEKKVSSQLLILHKKAQDELDVHLVDALENDLLREQVESTRRLQGMITRLERMSTAPNTKLAEFLFDKELREKS